MTRAVLILFILGQVCIATGAEPEANPSDLPRIAPVEPDQVQATFQLKEGFRIEAVATEPLVVDPVSMAFDEHGRLFVVEMRGYSERRQDKLGRIRLLEDTDNDGRYDTSHIYADTLAWPTAVICWDGGVFVGVTPDILYLKDTDGDHRADIRERVFTGFGGTARLNVQAMINSFRWGIDNRIHGVAGRATRTVSVVGTEHKADLRGADFSFDPRKRDIRHETGGGQHGMSFNDDGVKFTCSNSRHIRMVVYDQREVTPNPHVAMPDPVVDIAVDGPAAEVFRISADEPWRIVRTRWRIASLVPGPVEGGGRVSGYFTAATGITIYRGHAWPKAYQGNAFIGDAGSNLIHRKRLVPDGVMYRAERPADETQKEFLASTDNWFRPVQMANGPDGCLYIADMYREVIEHPWSLPQSIKQHLDLNSGNDRGRIYRIVPEGFEQPEPVRLGKADTKTLVQTLTHPNGWHRETASRLLDERQDPGAKRLLETALEDLRRRPGRFENAGAATAHVLQALHSAGELQLHHLWNPPDTNALEPIIRLAGELDTQADGYKRGEFLGRLQQGSPRSRLKSLLLLGKWIPGDWGPYEWDLDLANLVQAPASDADFKWFEAAALNSIGRHSLIPLERLIHPGPKKVPDNALRFAVSLAGMIGRFNDPEVVQATLKLVAFMKKAPPSGFGETITADRFALSIAAALSDGLKDAGTSLRQADKEQLAQWTIDKARHIVATGEGTDTELRAAIRLLASAEGTNAAEALTALIHSQQPATIRIAALESLNAATKGAAMMNLLPELDSLTDEIRERLLDLILARRSGVSALVTALENGAVPKEQVGDSRLNRLRTDRDPGIKQRINTLLGIQETRPGTFDDHKPSLTRTGKKAAGATIYRERCATCHRAGKEGHELGPDLASVRSSGREKLLLSIVEPSRELLPQFVQYDIDTRDGESLSGIIAHETATHVTVRQAGGLETVLLRKQIKRMQSRGRSLMPEELLKGLTHQQIADLLAFIEQH